MSCVHFLTEQARREATEQEKQRQVQQLAQKVLTLKDRLAEVLSPEDITALGTESIFFVPGSIAQSLGEQERQAVQAIETVGAGQIQVQPGASAATIKSGARKGTKQLAGRPDTKTFKEMPPEAKLQYIVDNEKSIAESRMYVEKDRTFLQRMKKHLHCYKAHCNQDVPTFLSFHGNKDKTNFNVSDFKVKNCLQCSSAWPNFKSTHAANHSC